MKNKKFWGAVATVWAILFLTDWLLHGMWLQPLYMATAQFWRPQEEAMQMMHWAWFGNLVFAWTFVWMFTKGLSKDNPWHQAFRYGFAVLFVAKFQSLMIQWTFASYPTELIWKWFAVGCVQVLVSAFAVAWIWRKDIAWAPTPTLAR